jgi:hypothetical protein
MTENHLHIIAFDVPYPANYGGVIDVFYRVKALSEAGVKVHLHCFEYGRGEQEVLSRCYEVKYYKRDTSFVEQLSFTPYIVNSRRSEALVQNLLKDNYPILCEGLHTTTVLSDKRLRNRKIYVRAHNVEHDYYRGLGDSERWGWKKLFYFAEAWKLKRYESVLRNASGIFAISQKDTNYFGKHFQNVTLIPGFNAADSVCSEKGRGEYVLYHGNLSVKENEIAAKWLIENVFSELDLHCIIAGLNPSNKLKKLADKYSNVTLVANPDDAEMIDLLRQAQVNILVTNQPTGLKLKLLNALYNGRFCLVNSDMVKGTSLESLCVVADEPEQMIAEIKRLMEEDFTEEDIEERDAQMRQLYNNEENAKKIVEAIFGRFASLRTE